MLEYYHVWPGTINKVLPVTAPEPLHLAGVSLWILGQMSSVAVQVNAAVCMNNGLQCPDLLSAARSCHSLLHPALLTAEWKQLLISWTTLHSRHFRCTISLPVFSCQGGREYGPECSLYTQGLVVSAPWTLLEILFLYFIAFRFWVP